MARLQPSLSSSGSGSSERAPCGNPSGVTSVSSRWPRQASGALRDCGRSPAARRPGRADAAPAAAESPRRRRRRLGVREHPVGGGPSAAGYGGGAGGGGGPASTGPAGHSPAHVRRHGESSRPEAVRATRSPHRVAGAPRELRDLHVAAEPEEDREADADERERVEQRGRCSIGRTSSLRACSVGTTTIWFGPMRYGPSAPDTSQFGK